MPNSEEEQKALLEHFRFGLNNSQETIRALDAKAGVISAFTFLILTGWLGVVKFFIEENLLVGVDINLSTFFIAVFFIGIFFSGVSSMIFLVWSAKGRDKDKDTFYALFPYYLRGQREIAKKTFYDEGLFKTEAQLNEFRDQLVILGSILEKKIRCGHYACIALLVQLGCLVLFLVGLILLRL
ncbi:hypothetical protein P3T73_03435 [Kiritimatiellota bacterium B12222]|nr:hypothetical protein P3T73_03435 [Kiritimatiellota bacterium B12222]